MALEIERKFLVEGDFRPFATGSTHIRQGYIGTVKGRTVRIRIRDQKGYLTIKGSSADGGLSRFEWEKEIPVNEAEELLLLCERGIVDKERFLVPAEDGVHVFEVDVFHGENEGLVMAEVELGGESEDFSRPSWLGAEVTGKGRYYNSSLRSHPFSEWSITEKSGL